MRGHYKGKLIFVDGDGIVHMQFEYFFEISKDWWNMTHIELVYECNCNLPIL